MLREKQKVEAALMALGRRVQARWGNHSTAKNQQLLFQEPNYPVLFQRFAAADAVVKEMDYLMQQFHD